MPLQTDDPARWTCAEVRQLREELKKLRAVAIRFANGPDAGRVTIFPRDQVMFLQGENMVQDSGYIPHNISVVRLDWLLADVEEAKKPTFTEVTKGDALTPAEIPGIHEATETLKGIERAFEPVNHWYESDEHEPRRLSDKIADAVADLQEDRAETLVQKKELRQLRDQRDNQTAAIKALLEVWDKEQLGVRNHIEALREVVK